MLCSPKVGNTAHWATPLLNFDFRVTTARSWLTFRVTPVADIYPKTMFNGMDLSPIQPAWVPENTIFVVDDIEHEQGWTYQENMFDMIHMRHTLHSTRNRKEVFSRIYKLVFTHKALCWACFTDQI